MHSLRFCFVFGALLLTASATANEAKVQITSFVAAGSRTRAAEVCGKVTGAEGPWVIVKIAIDEKSDRPGLYNVIAGADGLFCTTVVSYYGTASATLLDGNGSSVASSGVFFSVRSGIK